MGWVIRSTSLNTGGMTKAWKSTKCSVSTRNDNDDLNKQSALTVFFPAISTGASACNWHSYLFQAAGGLKNDFECDDMVLNDQRIGSLVSS